MIICDDVLHWAETYDGPPFHALLADAPYHLISDTRNGSPRNPGTGPFGRIGISTKGKGFMGKDWDGGSISYQADTWRALAQHLLPGAFGLAFGSARGWHRLACAIEDAGMIIHPSIFMLGWAYGSGWPKATRISSQVDEAYIQQHKTWAGHRYGRQMMKPALEPIILFQVPYEKRPVDSIVKYGAGALNIDGARIAGREPHHNYGRTSGATSFAGASSEAYSTPSAGRWPPNLALIHDPRCQPLGPRQVPGSHDRGKPRHNTTEGHMSPVYGQMPGKDTMGYGAPDGTETVLAYQCVESCPVKQFDRQAGHSTTAGARSERSQNHVVSGTTWGTNNHRSQEYTDSGMVSRFFPTPDWALNVAEQLTSAGAVFYAGKASPAERLEGLQGNNPHPTVKNLALCQWLATLLAPPAAYAPRRLLVPFAGVGSEMIGAVLSHHWEEVIGIESDPQYAQLGRQRLAYWTTQIAAQLSLWEER